MKKQMDITDVLGALVVSPTRELAVENFNVPLGAASRQKI